MSNPLFKKTLLCEGVFPIFLFVCVIIRVTYLSAEVLTTTCVPSP